MFALFPFLIVVQAPVVISTPYAESQATGIGTLKGLSEISQFGLEEIEVNARGTYKNPFDPEDVALEAEVTSPSGTKSKIFGFLYRPFQRILSQGEEKLNPLDKADWRLRICPTEAGTYSLKIRFRDEKGAVEKPFTFSATKNNAAGFIRVSPKDKHYFDTTNGGGVLAIGANVCWAGKRGTYDYDDWLLNFGKSGCNYYRLWLEPAWSTFDLERKGKSDDGDGFGQFDLGGAWKLDYVLEYGRQHGMSAMLCLDSYNELRTDDASPSWSDCPWNKDNGGPLRIPSDFWTNAQMAKDYRNKLRYLVARYAAYTEVFSWEFWNEVDLVKDFSSDRVAAWHQEMGNYLHAIDPYHHMVTTSFSDSMGNRSTDLLPEMDYVQTHLYDPKMVSSIAYQSSRKGEWGKPHYVGEVGADSGGPRVSDDPTGLQVHDPLWVSVTTGGAGTAMSWWWDELIAPRDLYPLYAAIFRFVRGVNFASEQFQTVPTKVALADQSAPPMRGDLVIDDGPISFNEDPVNKPITISLDGEKLTGSRPSRLLHGTRNHPSLHNPLTIQVKEQNATTLDVEVSEVSTYGGASLQIQLDGALVVNKAFPTGENNQNPDQAHKFDGVFSVVVPAGRHTVTVNNVGPDWIRVGYRFISAVTQSSPAVSYGIGGTDMALVWVERAGRNWHSVVELKQTFAELPETVLTVPGLARGNWRAEVWDTWTGKVMKTSTVPVGLDGNAKVPLPKFSTDLAVKLMRSSS